MSDVNKTAAEMLRERFKWTKIHAPQPWEPRNIGEELVGYYGGKTLRNGKFGQYAVVLIHVPMRGSVYVSGTAIIQLVDSSMVQMGHPVRIVWQGRKQLGDGHEKKCFDFYIAEGPPLAESDLPEVRWPGRP